MVQFFGTFLRYHSHKTYQKSKVIWDTFGFLIHPTPPCCRNGHKKGLLGRCRYFISHFLAFLIKQKLRKAHKICEAIHNIWCQIHGTILRDASPLKSGWIFVETPKGGRVVINTLNIWKFIHIWGDRLPLCLTCNIQCGPFCTSTCKVHTFLQMVEQEKEKATRSSCRAESSSCCQERETKGERRCF